MAEAAGERHSAWGSGEMDLEDDTPEPQRGQLVAVEKQIGVPIHSEPLAGPRWETSPTTVRSPHSRTRISSPFVGIGEQGMRNPVDYAEALRVKAFYPLHQDLGRHRRRTDEFVNQAASEFATRGIGSVFRPLQDPGDYLQPMILNPHAERWTK